jgi:ATP-dependent Clp protease ATP-binding subunit ClpA
MSIDAFDVRRIAEHEASLRRDEEVQPLHILLALLSTGEDTLFSVLAALGADLESLRGEVRRVIGPKVLDHPMEGLPLAEDTKRIFVACFEEGLSPAERIHRPEHLLLGILRVESTARSLLLSTGVTYEGAKALLNTRSAARTQRIVDCLDNASA